MVFFPSVIQMEWEKIIAIILSAYVIQWSQKWDWEEGGGRRGAVGGQHHVFVFSRNYLTLTLAGYKW